MVGVRVAANLPQSAKKSEVNTSAKDSPAISLMSAPAAKAFPLPVMTMAPIPSSASNSAAAVVTSTITRELSALRASGRFSVIVPTRPSRVTRMVS